MSEEKKNKKRKKNDSEQPAGGASNKTTEKSIKKEPNPNAAIHQFAIVLLVVFALFIAVCYAFSDSVGVLGGAIRDVLFGLFGVGAFVIPFLLVQMAIFWKRDVSSGAKRYKYIVAILLLLFLSALSHAIYCLAAGERLAKLSAFRDFFSEGCAYHGGGFFGGVIGAAMIFALGYPGTMIFTLLFLVAFAMALFGLTPSECAQRYRFYRNRNRKIRAANKEQQKQKKAEAAEERLRREEEAAAAARAEVAVRHGKIDSEIFEDDFATQESESKTEVLYPIYIEQNDDETIDLDDIFSKKTDEAVLTHYAGGSEREMFTDDTTANAAQMELEVEKKPLPKKREAKPVPKAAPMSAPAPAPAPAAPAKPDYQFPPVSLLQLPASKGNTDASAELRENANRIIETLNSFNVHVKISNVSRGPTITRYELEPEAGTRVRSILNLLDDIALSLATSGVRSDGVIAGKSAIGIEVPNKITNSVYVRELVEDKRFDEAKSRLTTCLGMDVAGAPVYLDVAKMPHLLIAGATGAGKSVCINSLLVSLLYKARPDEVKLILIDPKKVELNIYNGLPHLLVPVVFDPKKAAGSLHWAVTEMERRFELLEALNTRNIEQYNKAIEGDPTRERMTQVVIIIDELADLMMTAPDDVEASICRLAQKARAAGMHLILGTQRPSVDVITGLIKANIPSRIAFRSSSQIDSRTILDQQGAEKLIGKGDMLYAPVGSDKPIRVQGAFVSEKEIDEIVEFIKSHSQECAYSSEVIEQIDKAAEVCGQKKKGASPMSGDEPDGDAGEDEDPMLEAAIELAVESGKISTSLIQRRLSLGYGRAAKLIDVMESRGIVSAPDGQKPRTVLMTREQFLERKMRTAEASEEIEDDEPPFDV